MRLVVSCTLEPPEIEAIERGESSRAQVKHQLTAEPRAPPDPAAAQALDLPAWMVARGHLDVRVAVPCDGNRQPAVDVAIFHEKRGIIEDRAGNRLAWTGSLNETEAGWTRNWESLNVFTSSGPEPARVDGEELTATPMQLHPVEVWDLLDLLGLPPEWTEAAFLDFFAALGQPNPPAEAFDRMARLFQAVERDHGAVAPAEVSANTTPSSSPSCSPSCVPP